MMDIKEMKALLKEALPYKRFNHSVLVYETALRLAKCHQGNEEKIAIAALLHDCGRQIPTKESLAKAKELGIEIDEVEANQPILLHAKLGVYYATHRYGVTDPEILDAIAQHTTGAANMTTTAMIVYLADLLEPTRDFYGIEDLRKLAKKDLERTMFKAYAQTIRYLLEYDLLVHPKAIEGYNQIAAKYKKESRK